jgi:hypothetical protein
MAQGGYIYIAGFREMAIFAEIDLPVWKHSELVFEKRQVIADLQELLASYS